MVTAVAALPMSCCLHVGPAIHGLLEYRELGGLDRASQGRSRIELALRILRAIGAVGGVTSGSFDAEMKMLVASRRRDAHIGSLPISATEPSPNSFDRRWGLFLVKVPRENSHEFPCAKAYQQAQSHYPWKSHPALPAPRTSGDTWQPIHFWSCAWPNPNLSRTP